MSDEKSGAAQEQGVAHIPATVLTVEYVDDSEGMEAAIREIDERLSKLDERIDNIQERQAALVAALNQQAKDIGRYLESLGRRVDQTYRLLMGSDGAQATVAVNNDVREDLARVSKAVGQKQQEAEPEPQEEQEVPEGDENHEKAWRVARVLAADLEAYHEDAVKEGVLYGTFFKLLHEPIEKARMTYEQRVPREIVDNYDYFSKALDELIARKRMELESGQSG